MSDSKPTDAKPDSSPSASPATFATRVLLNPVASQTFLVSVAAAFCICLVCATTLFLAGKDAAWVFVLIGASIIGAALWAWLRSQSDVDLQASAPTMLSMPNGATVSTDSRNLRNPGAVTAIMRIFEANQREPLPPADALFADGVVVPYSAGEAKARTERINCEVQAQAGNFQVLLGEPQSGPTVLQRPLDEVPRNDSPTEVQASQGSEVAPNS